MKYRIYELIKPEHLQKTEPDGYYMKTIERNILQRPEYNSGLDDSYSTFDDAISAIEKNKNQNKYKELCVLPIICINWEGVIE